MAKPRPPLGHPRYGGRKKGVPNIGSRTLMERAAALGVDPFDILLFFSKGDWEKLGYESKTETIISKGISFEVDRITPDHRLKAASEACQYLHPKRKAIDVTDVTKEKRDATPEEVAALRAELKDEPPQQ